MIKPTSKPKRKSKNLHSSLNFEALEPRRILALGIAGNDCPPDLDLSGVPSQMINVGAAFTIDLLAAGGTVMDVDEQGDPTGDPIRFLLDPDVPTDTPVGASITDNGIFIADKTGSDRWFNDNFSACHSFADIVVCITFKHQVKSTCVPDSETLPGGTVHVYVDWFICHA